MNTIQFDKNNIIKMYSEGMESTIYLYKKGTDIVIFKQFKKKIEFNDHFIDVSDNTLENKRKKLEIIHESEIFKDEVEILDLVYDNETFIGYTMPIIKLKKFDIFDSKKEKIFMLKELREKIRKFNDEGIYIGDLNPNNIFLTENGILLCDLDNIRIKELDFDLKNSFQIEYLNKCKNIDNIDNYSFNLFTVAVFGRFLNSYVWDNLNNNGLPHILNSKKNRQIIEELRNINDNNYEKKYLIDNMRKF